MIVQISSVSTPAMETMCCEIKSNISHTWVSNYATRPSYLFDGVCMNLTIILSAISTGENEKSLYSTKYMRWNPDLRQALFFHINYNSFFESQILFNFALPKLTAKIETDILKRLGREAIKLEEYLAPKKIITKQKLFYRTAGGRYFKIFSNKDFGSESKSNKSKCFIDKYDVNAIISVLSSNIWWWYYTLHFDMYNCKDYMMYNFPFDYAKCTEIKELVSLGEKYVKDIFKNAEAKTQEYASTGERNQLIFKPALSKPIIDEIDRVLAKHYGFTDEELDFIINYDIKYRMGGELDSDG
jgi:hypothetical protein